MIDTAPALVCPVCGSAGEATLTGCRDYVCGLPGSWTFHQCERCRSLWLNPMPTPASIPQLYPENYGFTKTGASAEIGSPETLAGSAKLSIVGRAYGYRGVDSRARSRAGLIFGRLLAHFAVSRRKAGHAVRFLRHRPGGRLLDVGCGNGAFLELMSKLEWDAEGVEPDPAAARVARARGLRIRVATVESAELPPEYYDAITLTHVAEHFHSPRTVLELLARALKPGGLLVSISPNPQSVIGRLFGNHWYGLDPPRHLTIPSARGYRLMLKPLGFEVKAWTSMRLAYWSLAESMSIRRTGGVNCHPNGIILGAANAALSILPFIAPFSGEEVVCYASKG